MKRDYIVIPPLGTRQVRAVHDANEKKFKDEYLDGGRDKKVASDKLVSLEPPILETSRNFVSMVYFAK